MEQREFGKLPDGSRVDLFTLTGAAGITVKICNYGGRIVSLETPDRKGQTAEIGMGFPDLSGYTARRNYAGALVGRVANRIRDGKFTLEGKEYALELDAKGTHLHGGAQGFSLKLWRAADDGGRLRLDYLSPDGEEHYPGNLAVTVWYSLTDRDLKLEYKATTDKTTIVNLTNHAFFNLNGFKRDILAHELRLAADHYTPVDAKLIPTGEITPVKGTPFDFNAAKPIGRDIEAVPGGYDHNYVFKSAAKPGEWLAEAYDPDSGRTLSMATDQPCTQFYAGNFLDGSQTGIGGAVYKRRYAFCLEAQKHPDAINHPNFTSIVLKPGETYRQVTVYRFGTR